MNRPSISEDGRCEGRRPLLIGNTVAQHDDERQYQKRGT